MANSDRITQAVDCPRCGVKAGQPCRNPETQSWQNGEQPKLPHRARGKKWLDAQFAKPWPDGRRPEIHRGERGERGRVPWWEKEN